MADTSVTVSVTVPARTYRPSRGRKLWRRLPRVARFLTLLAIGIIFAFPFYWVILTSLLPSDHVFDFPPSLWPRWDFANYRDAWNAAPWGQYFLNTMIICAGTTAMVLITSILAGYALATMVFPGKRVALAIIFGSLIMPAVVAIIPDYVILNWLGWLNTYQCQIVPWGASTFGIFLLQQFFRGLPTELWDAARIDGCSRLRFLWAIAAPLAVPILATVALFTFLGAYNSLLWALVMTSTNGINAGVQPIEVGVYSFIGENGTAYNLLCAATVFTTLPVVILFLLLQRTFVAGVIRTGIKG